MVKRTAVPPKAGTACAKVVKKETKLKTAATGGNVTSPTRRLWRRTSDETARRSLKLKLHMFPQSQIDGNLNENRETALQAVKKELHKLKAGKKHLPQAFWTGLIQRHKLTGSVSQSLLSIA